MRGPEDWTYFTVHEIRAMLLKCPTEAMLLSVPLKAYSTTSR